MIIEIMATQKFVTHLQPKRAGSRINTGFQLFLGHSNSSPAFYRFIMNADF
jgi:hypothetical protein